MINNMVNKVMYLFERDLVFTYHSVLDAEKVPYDKKDIVLGVEIFQIYHNLYVSGNVF